MIFDLIVFQFRPDTLSVSVRVPPRLLRSGIDTKRTDMSDCAELNAFKPDKERPHGPGAPREAAILEICVYPVLSERQMRRIARVIRSWAGLTATPE